jgi:hypothetical protein
MSHIEVERLRIVAKNEALWFTSEESDHLSICVECFHTWAEFAAEAAGISLYTEDGQSDPEID